MIFETHQLPYPLDSFVESVFHFKGFIPDHSIERVVPTGHVFLIFELDGMTRNTFDNKTLEPNGTFTKAWISGVHRNYISISAHHDSEMFVVQFKPYGAYPFLNQPLENLNEKVLPAEKVLGAEVIELRQLLLEASDSKDKFLVVEGWLKGQFDQKAIPPQELVSFYQQMQVDPTACYLETAEGYPNSQKHLIDQFKKYVGLTPKYSQRILRFNEILQKVKQEEKVSWAKIAYECGFTDQSYFIKEFKHFSGFNPQEFIKQDFDQDENFFPLDREG